MTRVTFHCPHCQSSLFYRQGQNPKDTTCSVAVTVTASFNSLTLMKPVRMAFNSAGVRDTARTLKVGINTVIRTLKRVTSSPVAHADMALICELDEQ